MLTETQTNMTDKYIHNIVFISQIKQDQTTRKSSSIPSFLRTTTFLSMTTTDCSTKTNQKEV